MKPWMLALLSGASVFSLSPALSLDFTTGSLDSRITFSRPSLATMYDSTGKLTYAPNNLYTYSDTLSDASWTTTTVTKTGSAGAWVLTASGTAGFHIAYKSVALGLSIRHCVSFYAKAGTSNYVYLNANSATTSYVTAVFDLSTGVSGSASQTGVGATTGTIHSTTSEYLGNSVYRISMVFSLAATAVDVGIGITTAATGNTIGNYGLISTSSGGTVTVYNSQLEAVTYQTTPSTYVATTASAYYGPRFDYNPSTLAARGLLIEEARTNSATYSQTISDASWSVYEATKDGSLTTAPDGTNTGYKLVETTANDAHVLYKSVTATAVAWTASVYLKAINKTWVYVAFGTSITPAAPGAYFNLSTGAVGNIDAGVTTASITDVGNGWYRCSITRTATAATWYLQVQGASANGTNTYAGNVANGYYVWGGQIEAGSFATSYIPTGSSSVARSADTTYMSGTNFSSWYNQSEGTIVAQYMYEGTPSTGYPPVYSITDTSGFGTNHIRLVKEANTNSVTADMYSGGAAQASWTVASTTVPFAATKGAFAYKLNDTIVSFSGTNQTADTSCAVPVTATYLSFGGYTSSAPTACIWLQAFTYYRSRLSNTRLQALTA